MNNNQPSVRPRILGIIGFAVLVAGAIFFATLESRHKATEESLRSQIEEKDRTIKSLQANAQNDMDPAGDSEADDDSGPSAPAAVLAAELELSRRIADMTLLQSNMLVLVERLAARTASPDTTSDIPAKTAQAVLAVKEDFMAEYQKDYDTAKQKEEMFTRTLSVTPEIARIETKAALESDNLSRFWPYFEARRDREEAQNRIERMRRALERAKINAGIESAIVTGK